MCWINCINSFGCLDVNPRIIRDPTINKWRRYTIVVSFVLLGLFSFASFITAVVWITRISPWYLKGKKASINSWIFVLATCIVTLISFLCFTVFTIKLLCKKNGKSSFGGFNFFTWASIVIIFVAYAYGTDYAIDEKTRKKIKILCSAPYFACIEGIEEGLNDINMEKYEKWRLHGINYVCTSIIGPALVMVIIQFVLYILFISLTTGCCCCRYNKYAASSKSEDEDDEKKDNNIDGPPNQNSKEKVEEV